MAHFSRVRWVNFLSTGSAGNEIELDATRTTLITGKNGSGKSTGVTDAICFVLFGKPFRSINKPQLVNSINNKNCFGEVDFSENGKKYTIKRGIKPALFEIWEDGVLLNKEAASKDYQKILEEQILRFNYKTFTQVVILGSATFVPFMELPKASRREVIEDILDIGVFSKMNDILKGEVSLLKENLSDMEYNIKIHGEKIKSQNKIISVIELSNEEKRQTLIKNRESLIATNAEVKVRGEKLRTENVRLEQELAPITELQTKLTEGEKNLTKIKMLVGENINRISFFDNHQSCPTCSQEISESHKENIVSNHQIKINELTNKKDIIDSAVKSIKRKITKLEENYPLLEKVRQGLSAAQYEYKFNNGEISKIDVNLESLNKSGDIETEQEMLVKMKDEAVSLLHKKLDMLSEKQLKEQALVLLKDSGIKTSIIRDYLTVINRKINEYLESMDFFCAFHIDEEFNEVIKSRHRDNFTYESFSQGQKQRIDIAIMLCFREIAKMKNSMNTNLLVLDEIFSSSLDKSTVAFLVDMLNDMEGSNVFVVTHHPDEFQESFDRHLEFIDFKNFSIMKEVS